MAFIDAHQHFWSVQRTDYGWLVPEMTILYQDYLPNDLHPTLEKFGILRCVAVQAAPSVEETEFLLHLCREHEFVAGVVGWIDLDSDNFEATYARLRTNPRFIGIRPMIQDLQDDWLLRKRVLDNLGILARDHFTIDLQARPRHLRNLRIVLERYPTLRAVIDHAAKPFIADGQLEPWKTEIRELAQYKSVYCKLSGLITEARLHDWTIEDFRPYVEHLVDVFGPHRLMFGSDWPVCLESGSYDDVWQIAHEALPPHLSEAEKSWIFGKTCARFYGL